MTPAKMRFAAAFLLVSCMAATMPIAAFAAEAEQGAAAQPATPTMRLSPEEVDKLEAMSQEERLEFFKQRREEFASLSPEDQQKRRQERKAAFESLPADQQASIKERTQKIIDELYNPQPRDVKEEKAAAAKQADAFVNSLSPEQKAKWDEIRKNSKKWDKRPAKAKAPAEDSGDDSQ